MGGGDDPASDLACGGHCVAGADFTVRTKREDGALRLWFKDLSGTVVPLSRRCRCTGVRA
jgi:hypothetical protein